MKEEHRIFAEAILRIGRNGETVHTPSSAYESAYPGASHETALRQSSWLLKKPEVQAYIQKRRDARQKRTELSEDRVLKELMCMGLVNVGDMLEDDGSLRPISEIERDDMAAVTGLDIVELPGSKGEAGATIKKVKTNKIEALDKLSRHLGLFNKDNKQRTEPVNLTMNFGPPAEDGD